MALKIMGIHGLGDQRGTSWDAAWKSAICSQFPNDQQPEFVAFSYDDIFFDRVELTAYETASAVAKLGWSALSSTVGGWFDGLLGRRGFTQDVPGTRGAFDWVSYQLKRTAGYVVAWVEDDDFRRVVRDEFLRKLGELKPDVLVAHSLGSLISYDAITSDADLAKNEYKKARQHLRDRRMSYVTLGSQLANPFVIRNLTPGRIVVPDVKFWWHLYNRFDSVFTREIRIPGSDRFQQVNVNFDVAGMADHEATCYLADSSTTLAVWTPLPRETSALAVSALAAGTGAPTRSAERGVPAKHERKKTERQCRMRAVLVEINEYPDPASRLAGCVNDVYLTSSVLQECGFDAEQIRVVLDARATASGIRGRLEWLVEDVRPGDTLFFYYSGHGAQLPTYGDGDAVDRMDETLVPYDFDWSPSSCVTDDAIYDLYSQLPYDTRLVMVFDCCHAGGIHRDGAPKARGLTPPDDIRHRCLKWDADSEMWIAREFDRLSPGFEEEGFDRAAYFGASGAVSRIGRAARLRGLTDAKYDAKKKTKEKGKLERGKKTPAEDAVGPYLPVILEACQENQLAYEYRNGAESYGAFTYSLAKTLQSSKTSLSFFDLVTLAEKRIERLGYSQKPAILGPSKIVNAPVPWLKVSTRSKTTTTTTKKKSTRKKT